MVLPSFSIWLAIALYAGRGSCLWSGGFVAAAVGWETAG